MYEKIVENALGLLKTSKRYWYKLVNIFPRIIQPYFWGHLKCEVKMSNTFK